MNILRKKSIICFYVMLSCIMCLACTANVCSAKNKSNIKAKELKLEPKETYKIKCKKASKYTSSKPRVASVSKKGKIKAKETGKTTIKVYNKN